MKYLSKNVNELTDADIIRGFKKSGILNSYSHFSPLWSKYFAECHNCHIVADPFGGWGHHLIGLSAAGCKVYYNDIVQNTVDDVKRIINYIHADANIVCGDAKDFVIPDECDSVFMCPPYYNVEEYECGPFKSLQDYNELIAIVIGNFMNSNAKTLGVIIREDYEYLFDDISDILVSKELVNSNKMSHFTKKNKVGEYLYVFKK